MQHETWFYKTPAVLRITGATDRQVDNASRGDRLPRQMPSGGSGDPRFFTPAEVVCVKLVVRLLELNCKVEDLVAPWELLVQEAPIRPTDRRWLCVDAEGSASITAKAAYEIDVRSVPLGAAARYCVDHGLEYWR